MAARRKPGVSIPESDRHTVKRTLRLTPAESAALDSVAEARGVNVSRAVGALAVEYVDAGSGYAERRRLTLRCATCGGVAVEAHAETCGKIEQMSIC